MIFDMYAKTNHEERAIFSTNGTRKTRFFTKNKFEPLPNVINKKLPLNGSKNHT